MERAPERTVWLVGAGASISETAGHFPSLLDLPSKARELGLLAETKDADGTLRQVSKYLRQKHYGDFTQTEVRVDLESVLTLIDIDIAVTSRPKLLLVRDFLLQLLRKTLRELHEQPFERKGEYQRMLAGLGSDDSIISFNWDLLLDNALGRTERLTIPRGTDAPRLMDDGSLYAKFLIEFSAWGERTFKRVAVNPPVDDPEIGGLYIKAHGSIDWYYCADSTCRAFGRVYPRLLGPRKLRPYCPECMVRTAVMIVPPTLNKRTRELPFLRRIWGAAARELERATAVVVWGYSMPPTDFFSEWLVRHARSPRCKRLTIINPECLSRNAEPAELRASFIERFVSALRLPGRSIDLAVFETFADYEANQDVAAKYPHLADDLRRARRRRKSSVA